jgi:hypothetical protein
VKSKGDDEGAEADEKAIAEEEVVDARGNGSVAGDGMDAVRGGGGITTAECLEEFTEDVTDEVVCAAGAAAGVCIGGRNDGG